jgi:hypothetical protein
MAARLAWVLNLDADLELAALEGGLEGARVRRYEPRKGVRLAMSAHVEVLAASLLGPGDLLIDEAGPAGIARGLRGRAFCPTPRALAILERAGAEPEPHPPLDVLRRVNSRAFASALGATLPGAAFVTTLEVARAMLRAVPVVGSGWRVKHAFGMAGRNQRIVAPSAIDERDERKGEGAIAFLRVGLARGGVQIEPNVAIDAEYAVHGMLDRDGSVVLGAVMRQRCDAHGAWVATEPIARHREDREGLDAIVERMTEEARSVARALGEAGYFGPFGVDGYTYRNQANVLCLQPRSEINARYSMGFATGWGPSGDRPRDP